MMHDSEHLFLKPESCKLVPASCIVYHASSAAMNSFREKTFIGKIITYSSIGIQVGLTIGIGIIAGVYGDRWLNTGPWLTLLGLLIGVVSGFTRLYQIGKELSRK